MPSIKFTHIRRLTSHQINATGAFLWDCNGRDIFSISLVVIDCPFVGLCFACRAPFSSHPPSPMKSNFFARLYGLLIATFGMACGGGVVRAQSNIPDLARLKLAAEGGDAKAQFEYGTKIALSNPDASFATILKSAAQGYEPAEERAGYLLIQRASFNKERAKLERMGVRFTARAAFKGDVVAQERLSECFERGTVFSKNLVMAYAWMAIALRTAGGPKEMRALAYKGQLDRLIANLPSSAIAEGQRIADNFRPTKTGLEALLAETVMSQIRLSAIYLGADKKVAVVNQTQFAEGETKELPIDDGGVQVTCVSIDARAAAFRIGSYGFTLTTK